MERYGIRAMVRPSIDISKVSRVLGVTNFALDSEKPYLK